MQKVVWASFLTLKNLCGRRQMKTITTASEEGESYVVMVKAETQRW